MAEYEFDGLGHRISETAGGVTRHFYDSSGWQVLEEGLGTATRPERQMRGSAIPMMSGRA